MNIFANRIISILFLIIAALYFVVATSFRSSWKIYPQVLAIILLFLAIYWLFQQYKYVIYVKNENNSGANIEQKEIVLPRFFGTIFATIFYIIFINFLGFYASTVIFLFFLMYFLGVKKIIVNLMISIVFTISIYLIFFVMLEIPTPKGIIM